MADPTEVKPSGVAYVLARLKGFWAALLPLYTIYQAATSDGTITQDEYTDIGKALVFFVGVWLIPNLGYVRKLRDRYGRVVTQGVDDTVTMKVPSSATGGRHEFVDEDQDGVSDAEELRANNATVVNNQVYNRGQSVAARRLQEPEGRTEEWDRP